MNICNANVEQCATAHVLATAMGGGRVHRGGSARSDVGAGVQRQQRCRPGGRMGVGGRRDNSTASRGVAGMCSACGAHTGVAARGVAAACARPWGAGGQSAAGVATGGDGRPASRRHEREEVG